MLINHKIISLAGEGFLSHVLYLNRSSFVGTAEVTYQFGVLTLHVTILLALI